MNMKVSERFRFKTIIRDNRYPPSICGLKALANSHRELKNRVACDLFKSGLCTAISNASRIFLFAICLLFRSTFQKKVCVPLLNLIALRIFVSE